MVRCPKLRDVLVHMVWKVKSRNFSKDRNIAIAAELHRRAQSKALHLLPTRKLRSWPRPYHLLSSATIPIERKLRLRRELTQDEKNILFLMAGVSMLAYFKAQAEEEAAAR